MTHRGPCQPRPCCDSVIPGDPDTGGGSPGEALCPELQGAGVWSQAPCLLLAWRSRVLLGGLVMPAPNCTFLLGRLLAPRRPGRVPQRRLRSAVTPVRAAEPRLGERGRGVQELLVPWITAQLGCEGCVAPGLSSRSDPGRGTAAVRLRGCNTSHLGLPDVAWSSPCVVCALHSTSY